MPSHISSLHVNSKNQLPEFTFLTCGLPLLFRKAASDKQKERKLVLGARWDFHVEILHKSLGMTDWIFRKNFRPGERNLRKILRKVRVK